MTWRHQLPAYSPISLGAWLNGVHASVASGDAPFTELAQLLRGQYGCQDVVLTSSGTDALSLAIIGSSRGATPRVALPGYGCYDLATAAVSAGADVWLYDVHPRTLAPDWDSAEAALRAGATSLVVVHQFGLPVDLAQASALAQRHGAVLIEDAAQGTGGSFAGKPLGAWGDLAVLSFGRGKGMTGGGGGALLANSTAGVAVFPRLHALAAPQSNAGLMSRLAAQAVLSHPLLYGVPSAIPSLRLGETVYHAPSAPAGMARSSAGVLARQAAVCAEEATCRRANAARLLRRVQGLPGWSAPRAPEASEPGHLRLPLLREPGLARAGGDPGAARRLGVMPGYPRELAQLPGFGDRVRNLSAGRAGTAELLRSLLTLPTHSRLAPRDLDALESWLGNPDY